MDKQTKYKEYIGDGVYANFDGYQIWLTTEDGISTTNSIALEPGVYQRLLAYSKNLERILSNVDQP